MKYFSYSVLPVIWQYFFSQISQTEWFTSITSKPDVRLKHWFHIISGWLSDNTATTSSSSWRTCRVSSS